MRRKLEGGAPSLRESVPTVSGPILDPATDSGSGGLAVRRVLFHATIGSDRFRNASGIHCSTHIKPRCISTAGPLDVFYLL